MRELGECSRNALRNVVLEVGTLGGETRHQAIDPQEAQENVEV